MIATILIVEHHAPLRQSLHDWLAMNLPRCRVIKATNVAEAIELSRRSVPQIIVIDADLDIGIPQTNGLEAVRRIRAAAPEAQIVAIGLAETKGWRAMAAAAGAGAYVPKSVLQTELIPTLKAVFVQSSDE